MKEEDLEELNTLYGKQEVYILTRKVLAEYQRKVEESFLLRNGELVRGLYYTWCKKTVVRWVQEDGDVYLGIGALHK